MSSRIMKKFGDFYSSAFEDQFSTSSYLFYLGFRIWLLYQTAILIPFHDRIWSWDSYNVKPQFNGLWTDYLLQFSTHPGMTDYYLYFIAAQITCLIGSFILGSDSIITRALIYVTTMNVYALSGTVLDGGINISQLLAFYFIFINTSGHKILSDRQNKQISNLFSNAFFILAQFQIVTVYATAVLYKLNGELWQNGMAIYYILQNDTFTLSWLKNLVINTPFIAVVATYATLGFQILFPTMIWNQKMKYPLIGLGLMIHMGIAFGMGIFTFGIIMCLSYILFIPSSHLKAIQESLKVHSAFDENCVLCQYFAKFINRVSSGLVIIDSAQNPKNQNLQKVPTSERLLRLAAVDADGNIKSGFEAISLLLSRSIFAPCWYPLGIVLRYSGLGERIYSAIATSTLRKNCGNKQCQLKA